MKKRETADLADESHSDNPLNPLAGPLNNAEERKAAREEKEAIIADSDKDAIDKIILSEQFGKGGKIRVTRKGPLDQAYQFVTYIKADEWDSEDSIEYCRKMFGGGDYKCQTFRASGAMYKPFTFSIDYRYKGQLDEQAIKALADEKGQSADNTSKLLEVMSKRDEGLKMTDFVAMMQDSSKTNMQMMMMMMTMQQKSSEQAAMQQMQMMTAMMTAMSSAMAGKSSNGTENLLLELIKQKQERSPMSETLEMMAQIKDIFEPKKESEEKEDDVFSKIGKVAGPLLSGLMSGQQPQIARPQVTSPPAAQPKAEAPEAAPKLGGLYATLPLGQRLFFDSMLGAASRGTDPGLYADLIIDQTPPQELPKLKEILTAPDWCAKLFGDEQLVASIRPWLDELRQMVLEYGTESPEQHAPGSPAPNPAG
jgi:hypothetical protein